MRASIEWPLMARSFLLEGKLLAGRDADHRLHDVDAGDHLGDGVLDLHARVHLEEVEVVVLVDQELAGAGADVVDRLGRSDGRLSHLRRAAPD